MKLIQLSSNKSSFHTVNFKSGLNLIVGKKSNPDDTNTKNTYNGVGKSLLVYLIHFCLGSNEIKAFKEKIPDWDFYLKFLIDDEIYISMRNTSNQKEIFLNDEKLKLAEFRRRMLEKNFNISKKVSSMTFNTLFPRFIRRDRVCYNNFDRYISKEQDYAQLLNNAFLLGLDIDLIKEKKELREFQTNTDKIKKSLENDSVLKEHFYQNGDTEIEIRDLEEDINKLEKELSDFKIANNYDESEKEADELTYKLKELSNERTLITNNIKNIDKSMKIDPDISIDKIVKLYESANIEIPNLIARKLDDSINFHKTLLNKRSSRLIEELKLNKSKLKELERQIEIKGKKLDDILGYLKTHGALEEYTMLNKKLSVLRVKLQKLQEYQDIMKTYKIKLLEIKKQYNTSSIDTQEYIELNTSLINNIKNTFRELTKEFYDKGAGIKIESNDGENKLRYNIDVRIQDDSSDGVNEVKIFCYDLMVLLLQINHRMKFIFHDSRLFSNMDPRQRGTVFKLANKKVNETNLQYIATVNQDQLDSFKCDYTDDEFNSIVEDNIILKLTDESSESKLLGIQIDMKYEK